VSDDAVTAQLARWVQATPDALAVVEETRSLTYARLDRLANGLARQLVQLGVGPETLVALCLAQGAAMLTAQLATFKTRGAFVPLDPTWPEQRLRLVMRDSGARVLISDRDAAFVDGDVRVVRFSGDGDEVEADWPSVDWAPQQLAYVIYTSGSTGEPKGVEIEQHSLSQLVAWHLAAHAIAAPDRATILSSPAFDAAIWEAWPYLAAGATLYVADEITRVSPFSLRDWMAEHDITIAFLPTPFVELLLSRAWPAHASPSLRLLLTGGDRLRRFDQPLPLTLINNYGPTEATVVTTSGVIAPGPEVPHIGRPLGHARVYLLDDALAPVAPGAVGELYIGGAGVARGYRGRPHATAERFVPDPFAGGRMFRSGDLARLRADGNLDFIGRGDDQIKLRGFRIEPGEIERALLQRTGVRDAAVVAGEDARGERRLLAYIVCDAEVSDEALAALLMAQLPAYMIPAQFVRLTTLPRSPHGKIDRRALASRGG
jgi:amino acid adenylation domain-containing protein